MFERFKSARAARAAACLVISACIAAGLVASVLGVPDVQARECLDYELYGGGAGKPPLVGGLPLGAEAVDVTVQAGHAFVACGDDGLRIVELSQPSSPVLVTVLDLLGDVAKVAVWGEYVLAGVGSTIKIVDVTAAGSPVWVHTHGIGGIVRGVSVQEPLALVVADDAGLVVLDLEGSPYPLRLGALVTPSAARDVCGTAATAWLATDAGLVTVALDDPTQPSLTGSPLGSEPLLTVACTGDVVWAATADSRLIAYDVSDPRSPRELQRHVVPSAVVDMRLADGFAYLVHLDGRIRVAGIGTRGTYVPLGILTTPEHAVAIDGFGPYLVAADGAGGVQVGWHQCDLILSAGRDVRPQARLLKNVPNPINPGTSVIFSLSSPAHVKLTLHDARGRIAAILIDEVRTAGAHEVKWNGRLADGRRAPSGVWHVRLETEDMVDTNSLVVLR